jgi:hypothetical protein
VTTVLLVATPILAHHLCCALGLDLGTLHLSIPWAKTSSERLLSLFTDEKTTSPKVKRPIQGQLNDPFKVTQLGRPMQG